MDTNIPYSRLEQPRAIFYHNSAKIIIADNGPLETLYFLYHHQTTIKQDPLYCCIY